MKGDKFCIKHLIIFGKIFQSKLKTFVQPILITYWEFDALFNSMVDQLKREYQNNGKGDKFSDRITHLTNYPVNSKRKKLPNLTRSVSEHPGVIAYLKTVEIEKRIVSASKIYELIKKMKDKHQDEMMEEMPLTGIYCKIFFLYLGFEGYEQFKQTLKKAEFTGYYFSLNRKTVDSFHLKIIIHKGKAIAQIQGFHDFDKVTPLIGDMIQFNQCWMAQLKSKDFLISLQLHNSDLGRGPERLFDAQQLYGLLSGIGSEQNLLSGECVFLKAGSDNLTAIKRYLFLRRFFIKIKVSLENILDNKELEFDFLSINKLDHLSGRRFRLVTLLPDDSISQSKFEIDKYYSSELWTPEFDSPLACRFSPDNFKDGSVVVLAYRKTTVYSTFVIDLRRIAKPDAMYKGAFCVAGGENGSNPYGGRFIMMEDAGDFQPLLISKSKRSTVFNTPALKKLSNELLRFLRNE